MPFLYLISVTLHLFAAILWLGGMFFLALVGAPVLRRVEPASLRSELFRRILDAETLGSVTFWKGRYGQALAWKLVLVVAMVSLAAVHDFALGPRASRHVQGSPEAIAVRRTFVTIAWRITGESGGLELRPPPGG